MSTLATVLMCATAVMSAVSLILHALHKDKAADVVDEVEGVAKEVESVLPAPSVQPPKP